eukprot:CAMPEP_0114671564 /NCGR_PEP_ID=MMETSP0191-20121206/41362_1 /TAXON_ID=126664 /ORGANISM="Sorites sp." /LENGTH=126 /DNA_ID=CAMNT_0001931689 /DNA_START=24 /DNA_END=405 /DNA_ORIENTATION=-
MSRVRAASAPAPKGLKRPVKVCVWNAKWKMEGPDEDPLPCGGTEKLRDEKFKWKSGDVMEFLGSCRSSLAMRHPKMKDYQEDDDERFNLAVRDMTKEYRKKVAEEKEQAAKAVAEAEKVATKEADK